MIVFSMFFEHFFRKKYFFWTQCTQKCALFNAMVVKQMPFESKTVQNGLFTVGTTDFTMRLIFMSFQTRFARKIFSARSAWMRFILVVDAFDVIAKSVGLLEDFPAVLALVFFDFVVFHMFVSGLVWQIALFAEIREMGYSVDLVFVVE